MISTEELQKLAEEQIELSKRVKVSKLNKSPRYIAGVDVAYWTFDEQEFGACSVIVYDKLEKQVVEKVTGMSKIDFPYISGYLAYREGALELNTLKCCKHVIDIVMLDGNGLLHPRRAGEAVKIGVELQVPTIGIAKSYLRIDDKSYEMPKNQKGAYTEIISNGQVLGRVVRTMENVKPVFLSIGNSITLEEAMSLTLELCEAKSHIPVPTRLADIETHKVRDRYIQVFNEQKKAYDPQMLCSL